MAVTLVFEWTYADAHRVSCCCRVCNRNQGFNSSSLLCTPLINRWIPWDLIFFHSLTHSQALRSLIDVRRLWDPWRAYGLALLSPYCTRFPVIAPSLLRCTAKQNVIPYRPEHLHAVRCQLPCVQSYFFASPNLSNPTLSSFT